MLSNHNTPFIRELYKDYIKGFSIVKARRNVNSKASGRVKIEEIVSGFFNFVKIYFKYEFRKS